MIPKGKRPRDPNMLAHMIVQMSTGEVQPETKPEKNPAAVALSKLGASKGGKARAKSLTKKQREEIAAVAAAARWKKAD